ncbi:hypothetical protein AB0G15_42400 [Streptosporangium sp. NPDC023825]|uniref:hypothetical protein n=1 Tax=Streptosporangium sp. NPDC023825 TaxID=3154909 RepID=UPI00341FBDA1
MGSSRSTLVADPYAIYHLATKHGAAARAYRELASEGALTLIVPALSLASAHGLTSCGDRACHHSHLDDVSGCLRELVTLAGVRVQELSESTALRAGAAFHTRTVSGYVGDTVLASSEVILIAQERDIAILTTPQAKYCYVVPATLRFVFV